MTLLSNMPLSIIRRALVYACLAVTSSAITVTAFGQAAAYPSKPIRLIIPAAPGGGTDTLGRLVGKKLSEDFGQRAGVQGKCAADVDA